VLCGPHPLPRLVSQHRPGPPGRGHADEPSRAEILRRSRWAQANGAPAGAPSPGTSGRVTKRAPSCAGQSAPAWAPVLVPVRLDSPYLGSPPAAGRAWVPGCHARTFQSV